MAKLAGRLDGLTFRFDAARARFRPANFIDPQQPAVRFAQLIAVAALGLIVRFALIGAAGYRDDVVIFVDWFRSIALLPLDQVYAHTPGLNYPPMCVLMYKLESVVMHWFAAGPPSDAALSAAVKLPPILVDTLGAFLAYAFVRRHASHRAALLGAAFIALNPAIIYDSAFWGQNDSIPTVLALFAIYQLQYGNSLAAWLSITCALFFKPPVLLLVPLMLLYPLRFRAGERRAKLRSTAIGVGAACVVGELLALTFYGHANPVVATRHLIGAYLGFSNVFHYTSLNAFNLWALFWPFFTSDLTKILGLSLQRWGDVMFVAAAALIYWRSVTSRSASALLEASVLVLFAFFVLLTEMHERYLYYALFFCGGLIFKRPYRVAALVVSITLLLDLEYGLTFMYLDDAKTEAVNRFAFAPWLSGLCSAANVGAFVWLMAQNLIARKAASVQKGAGRLPSWPPRRPAARGQGVRRRARAFRS